MVQIDFTVAFVDLDRVAPTHCDVWLSFALQIAEVLSDAGAAVRTTFHANGLQQAIRVERSLNCRACVQKDFSYLEGEAQPYITMCGRDSVQIHERDRKIDLDQLRSRLLSTVSNVRSNDFLLRFTAPPYEVTVFADGRAILKGSKDPAVARSIYARYIGS